MRLVIAFAVCAALAGPGRAFALGNPASAFCATMDGHSILAKLPDGSTIGLCSLPGRKIVEACRRGDSEALVGLPAKAAAVVRTLAPNLTSAMLAQVNRWLPQDSSQDRFTGKQSETPLTRSWLTELSRRAADRNNENGVPIH